MAGHAYKAAVDELDVGVARDLDAPYRATVLEAIGKLNNYYSNINAAIDKRNHKVRADPLRSSRHSASSHVINEWLLTIDVQMLDYDSARAKVKKLIEKPADDTTKLPRVSLEEGNRSLQLLYQADKGAMQAQSEHDEARDVFNLLNDQLISELPLLLDLRIREMSIIQQTPLANFVQLILIHHLRR